MHAYLDIANFNFSFNAERSKYSVVLLFDFDSSLKY